MVHADLIAGGITVPTAWEERRKGDAITKRDLNGNTEIWYVIKKEPEETGSWLLTLQKNIRIVP